MGFMQVLCHFKDSGIKGKRLRDKNMFRNSRFLGLLALAVIAFSAMTASVQAEALPVTSPFGYRYHPISGEYSFHAGVDLGYDYGTQVPALFDGVVVMAGDYGDGYGVQALIYHGAIDCYTRYAHLSALAASPGMAVTAGCVIGYVGSSGNSTGPHLHLEYIVPSAEGGYVYVDPLTLWY